MRFWLLKNLTHNRLLLIVFLITLAVFSAYPAFSQTNQTSRYILDNGLTVIIKEVSTRPIVSLVCVVRAGSSTEGSFSGSGISHFIEHLLFKGTVKRGVGEIAREIKNKGGQINAYTSFDYTRYEIVLPAEHLDGALDILSDALSNASFDPQEMEKERNVILSELRRNNDDPDRFLSKLFWSTAFKKHPYRLPVIGYEELFIKLTRDDILKYYRQMYVSNNIILSIAGDVQTSQALLKVKKAFRHLPRGGILPYQIVREPVQVSKRELIQDRSVNLTHLLIGFHGPDINSPDLYPMDVAAIILGKGKSSRLYTSLKEKDRLVHSISAFSYTPRDPGIFGINALLEAKDIPKAELAIERELDRIKKGDITDKELSKARNMVLADYIFGLQTVEGQAGQLAISEALTGDFNFSKRYIEGINSVTIDDIKRTALKYFKPDNLTRVMLVPHRGSPQKTDNKKKTTDLPIEEIILRNGLTVLLKENHALPVVSIRVVMKGGVRLEDEDTNGISFFTAKMLLKGTKKRPAEKIFEETASMGASLSSYSANNSLGISLDLLKDDLEAGMDILMDILANSTFSQTAIEEVRTDIIARIKRNEEDNFYMAGQALKAALFTSHPYRFEPTGTKQSISNIARKDLLKFYKRYVTTDNMVIAIFGDIDPGQTRRMLIRKSKGLNSKPVPKITTSAEQMQTERTEIEKYMDKSEAIILIGFHSIPLTDNDKYVFDIITALLSGQDGRLFKVVRENLGLSYSVGSYHVMGLDPGYYIFYSESLPGEIDRVKDLLISQIELLRTEPVNSSEINRAKNALAGRWNINLQTNAALAFYSVLDELYGLGYNKYKHYTEKIREVTPEDIIRVANIYFDPEKPVIVTVTLK
ncbi:MAG: pitrilysin family protein [Candidatus Omnitrophota bacterium]|nr:pitrilysin family protein [Candidatus Omnitrophota bacterium]